MRSWYERTENISQSMLAFLIRPGHYPRSNNYKSNGRKANLSCCSLCRVMTVIMVEMIPRERTPNPGPCAAQCCHLGADISIVPVMDNDSYYAASMTTNDSHSPRYQWSRWRSQNIDDQEPMTFNSLPDLTPPWQGTLMGQSLESRHKVLIWSLAGNKSSHRWLTFVQIDDFQTTPLLVVRNCWACMDYIYFEPWWLES